MYGVYFCVIRPLNFRKFQLKTVYQVTSTRGPVSPRLKRIFDVSLGLIFEIQ